MHATIQIHTHARVFRQRVITRDAPIIGRQLVSAVLPIIGIGRLVRWYPPIVVYTIDKYKFLLHHGVSMF